MTIKKKNAKTAAHQISAETFLQEAVADVRTTHKQLAAAMQQEAEARIRVSQAGSSLDDSRQDVAHWMSKLNLNAIRCHGVLIIKGSDGELCITDDKFVEITA